MVTIPINKLWLVVDQVWILGNINPVSVAEVPGILLKVAVSPGHRIRSIKTLTEVQVCPLILNMNWMC